MTGCRLCGRDVRVAWTLGGRRVILDAVGTRGAAEGRFVVDDDKPTLAQPVAEKNDGFAYRQHRHTCPYGFVEPE